MGRSTPITAFDGTIWYFVNTIETHWTYAWRSLVHKKLFLTKWQLWELRLFSLIRLLYLCIDGAFMGRSTPTTAFNGAIWYFAYTISTNWTYAWRSLVEKKNWQNDSYENLDNYSLVWLLYMHRWCLHGPINSYHSFWWNNLILCQYNRDTLNICMKEFGSQKIMFDKMTAVRT